MSSAKDMASSIPGMEVLRSAIKLPTTDCVSSSSAAPSCMDRWNEFMSSSASISMQYRLSKPCTRVGSLPNFCEKASERLCAGSVETRRTFSRTIESRMPTQHEVVVLPTPPLPPTNTHFRDSISMMFRRLGSGSSANSSSLRSVMVLLFVC